MTAARSRAGIVYDYGNTPPNKGYVPRKRQRPRRRWPSRHVVRDHTICLLHRLGVPAPALARNWNLSPVRVHQIIAKGRRAA